MKKFLLGIAIAGTLGLLAWATYMALYVVPVDAEQGEVYRIFYYHVPTAMNSFLFFFLNLVASVAFLALRKRHAATAQMADAWALAAAEVGVVYCSVVLTTGPIWGRVAWGIWWTWDARLTTTLVLWLIYVSYLLLRRFAAGPQMQALAAVLAIFGALDVPIVYMANRWWRTQHPGPVFGGDADSGMKDPVMLATFGWGVLAWMAWGLLILFLRFRVERKQQRIEMVEAEAALAAN